MRMKLTGEKKKQKQQDERTHLALTMTNTKPTELQAIYFRFDYCICWVERWEPICQYDIYSIIMAKTNWDQTVDVIRAQLAYLLFPDKWHGGQMLKQLEHICVTYLSVETI